MNPSYCTAITNTHVVAVFLSFFIVVMFMAAFVGIRGAIRAFQSRPKKRKGNRPWSDKKKKQMGWKDPNPPKQEWDGTDRRKGGRRSDKDRRSPAKAAVDMLSGVAKAASDFVSRDRRGVPSEPLGKRPKTTSLSEARKKELAEAQAATKKRRENFG